jgi:Flp pilus assembly protein TadG
MGTPLVSRAWRRGAVTVLSAFLMVAMLAFVAFSVDIGYMAVVKTELQSTADSVALAAAGSMSEPEADVIATAERFAALNRIGGQPGSLRGIEFGTWDATEHSFAPSSGLSNAIRVTVCCDDQTGNNRLFFAKILGQDRFSMQASSVAMGNPRDVAFVVDLSGSMNNDTEPCWATNEINTKYGSGYPSLASNIMQQVYTDFGFGTFPGTLQYVGSPLVTANTSAYANLTKNGGPLTLASVAATYRITTSDSEATRKTKAYKWIIDNQLATLMPAARPTPSSANLNFWTKYLDYTLQSTSVSGRGTLPPSQDTDRLTSFGNPDTTAFPNAGTTERDSYRNKLGYRTYVQYMMDFGRNLKPDGSNYTQLSTSSSYCTYHSESTAGGTFSFPPSEQPVHSVRRSLIAAIQEVKLRNETIADTNQRDWVSIISFDSVAGTTIRQTLTGDYDAAMQACTRLQAAGDDTSTTATETGLILAKQHISRPEQGGVGRRNTQKVVVLLTDGMPNLKSSSNTEISNFRTGQPSSEFYGGTGGNYNYDAALMQTMIMQGQGWKVFAVGIGLGTDYGFMDRLARSGMTANNTGESPRTSGNPIGYETEVSAIFKTIISNPQVRIVK